MDLFDRLSLALPRLRLLREEPLAAHTSFRIGGPAEVMAFPSSLAELQALLRLSAQEGIRVRLLGARHEYSGAGRRRARACHRDERRADRPFHAGCSAYRGHVRRHDGKARLLCPRQRPDGTGICPRHPRHRRRRRLYERRSLWRRDPRRVPLVAGDAAGRNARPAGGRLAGLRLPHERLPAYGRRDRPGVLCPAAGRPRASSARRCAS